MSKWTEKGKKPCLHKSHGLSGPYTFLVNENQDAYHSTNHKEASHQAGYQKERVNWHRHQLVAAFSVVVPEITYRTSKSGWEKNMLENKKVEWIEMCKIPIHMRLLSRVFNGHFLFIFSVT